MKFEDYENKFRRLKEEKEKFLALVNFLDRRVSRGEITKYQKQFTITSTTNGLSEYDYIQKLDREIKFYENIIRKKQVMNNTWINIIKFSLGIIAILVILYILLIPEIKNLSENYNVRQNIITVNRTYDSKNTTIYPITLTDNTSIKSIRIDGKYNGNVRVYLVKNDTNTTQKFIIFDSDRYSANLSTITGHFIIERNITEKPVSNEVITLQGVCDETCKMSLDARNVYVLIEVDNNSSITIDRFVYTQPIVNHPPRQVKKIPNLRMNTSQLSINLSKYFKEDDQDILSYSISHISGLYIEINYDKMTIEAQDNINQTYSGFVYVSDGVNTINSNVFKIIVDTIKPVKKEENKTFPGYNSSNEYILPIKHTNQSQETNISLTNKTAIMNVSTESAINTTSNNTEQWQRYFGTYHFNVDSKLVRAWSNDPSATPRVIIKYKSQNSNSANEYSSQLKERLQGLKDTTPGDYDIAALTEQKRQLENKITTLINANITSTENNIDYHNNTITGHIVIEPVDSEEQINVEMKNLRDQINNINYKIANAEFSNKVLNFKDFKSVTHNRDAAIEVITTNSTDMEVLGMDDDIEAVYLDEPIESLIAASINLTEIDKARNLTIPPLNGSGVKICLLDTGVNSSIVQNYAYGFDFINNNTNPQDDNGHGTEVGYIIYSVAPGSMLIVGKVLDSAGHGYESDVLSGLQYCLDENTSIISLSLGGSLYEGHCDDNIVAQTVNELNNNYGILTIAATGNDGNGTAIRVPSCASGALPVTSSTQTDNIASFANYNNATLLASPGERIKTIDYNGQEIIVSGTSLSVPFVTGTVALKLEQTRNDTTAQLKSLLVHTGDVIIHLDRMFARLNALNFMTEYVTNNLTEQHVINNTIKIENQTYNAQTCDTGGTITTDSTNGYIVHKFTSSGTYTPCQARTIDLLIVAGGGGGGAGGTGSGLNGGGGGAGGLIYNSAYGNNAWPANVVVGGGGGGSTPSTGNPGGNGVDSTWGSSSVIMLDAVGGGGGAGTSNNGVANNGGSGGGGSHDYYVGNNRGTGTSGQGYNGGNGYYYRTAYPSGGGGGAGGTGGDGQNSAGGTSGAGATYSISGSSVTYATGGSGRCRTCGSGTGTSASANTGNGGQGGVYDGSSYYNGGNGGSGIVILRYRLSNGETCTYSNTCISGYCRADYSGGLSYCAPDSTSCEHGGSSYASGTSGPDCQSAGSSSSTGARWLCSSGSWGASSCTAMANTNNCQYTYYTCSAGSCSGPNTQTCASGQATKGATACSGTINSGNYCDKTYNCVTGACTDSEYYRACAGSGSTCTETGKVNACGAYCDGGTSGKVISATTYSNSACSWAAPTSTGMACDGTIHYTSCTTGACSGYYRYAACDGNYNCDTTALYNYNQINVYATAGYTLTTTCGTTGTAVCGYGSYDSCGLTNSQTRGRTQYYCDGGTTCNNDGGKTYDGTTCTGTCNNWCTSGNCGNAPNGQTPLSGCTATYSCGGSSNQQVIDNSKCNPGGFCGYLNGTTCSGSCTSYCNNAVCVNRAAGLNNVPGGTCCDTHSDCAPSLFCEQSSAGGITDSPYTGTCSPTNGEYPDLAEPHCIFQGNQRTCEPTYDISRGYVVQDSGTNGYNSKTVGMNGNPGDYPNDWWGHTVSGQGGVGYKTTSADSTLCLAYVYDPCSAGGEMYVKTTGSAATDIGLVDRSSPTKGSGCTSYGMWANLASYVSGSNFYLYQDASAGYYTREVYFGWIRPQNGIASGGSGNSWCCEASDMCVYNAPAQGATGSATGQCYSSGSQTVDVNGDGNVDYCSSGTWLDCNTDGGCSGGTPYCVSHACVQCRTAADCDDSNGCTDDSCNSGTCGHSNNAVLCRASAGTCDVAEYCSGGGCPGDSGAGTGQICSTDADSTYFCAAQTPYLQYRDRYCAAGDRAGCTGAYGGWKKPGTAQTSCTNLCNQCTDGYGTCQSKSCTLSDTQTTVNKRTVHEFTSGTGTFTIPANVVDIDTLIVGGGGGGGMDMGGGGGGGGVATNILTNPGFEYGTTGWWTNLAGMTTSTDSHSGTYSLDTTYSGSGDNYLGQSGIPVTVGHTYRLIVWAKASSSTTTYGTLLLQEDGGGYGAPINSGTLSLTTSWQQFNFGGTWSGITTARVILRPSSSVGVHVYYDDIKVIDTTSGVSFTVTVGPGGSGGPAGGTNVQPNDHQFVVAARNGQNSVFGSITAYGGGFGGSSYRGYTPGIAGGNGGSGGGSGGYNDNAGTFYGGTGTAGQGNRGGNSINAYYSGGGGGAGAQGVDSNSQPNGGDGVSNSILGTAYYWGGGGGGASYSLSTGGNGGAGGGGGGAVGSTSGGSGLNPGSAGGGGSPGSQTNTPGGNAGANTGGGGGGGSHYNRNNNGGDGGSGIVVLSICTGCYINGVCYNNGDANPGNGCQQCAVATSQTAWSNIGAGTDPNNACTDSGWDTCDNGYTCRKSNDGNCNGAGACTSTTTQHVNDGTVCSGTTCNTAPSGTTYCDITINCVTNACTAARYYRGYQGSGTSCSETNKQSGTSWSADASYIISETAYKSATTCAEGAATTGLYCGTATSCSDGTCTGTTYYRSCNGAGSCRTDNTGAASAADIFATAGYTLTGACGVTGTTLCGYSGYNKCGSTNSQTPGRDQYRCQAGGGACTYDVGDSYDGTACGGTCTSYCGSGSCGNRAAGATNVAGGTCCDDSSSCATGSFCETLLGNTYSNNPTTFTCSPTNGETPDFGEPHCVLQGNQRTCEPSYTISSGYSCNGASCFQVGMSGYTGNSFPYWSNAGYEASLGFKTTYTVGDGVCFSWNIDPGPGANYVNMNVQNGAGTRYTIANVVNGFGIDWNGYAGWKDLTSYEGSTSGNMYVQWNPYQGNWISELQFGYKKSEAGATDGSNSAWCCDQSTDCVDDAVSGSTSDGQFSFGWVSPTSTSSGCYNTGSCHDTGSTASANEYCSSGTWQDDDASSTACTACSTGYWNIGGGADATACCGDDANENRNTENTYSMAIAFNNGEDACCSSSSDCVAGSTCYTSYSSPNTNGQYTGLNPGGNDNKAYCYGGGGTWLNCDQAGYMNTWCANSGGTICGKPYAGGGDNNVCQTTQGGTYFPSALGDTGATGCGCCGDDTGENYITRVGATDAPTGYTTDSSVNVCCGTSTNCATATTCTATTGTLGTIPTKAYCNAGTWQGGDDGSTACTAIMGSGYWNIGGAADATGCCGDDSSETKDTKVCNGGVACTSDSNDDACCADSSYCVYSSTCYASGTTSANVGGDSANDYCSSGQWYDCNTDAQCDAGYYCSSNVCTAVGTPTISSVTPQGDKPLNSQLGKNIITWSGSLPGGYNYYVEETSPASTGIYTGTSTSYTHDSLTDNTQYCYRVRTQDAGPSHYSGWSSTVCNNTKDRTGPISPNISISADNSNNKMIINFTETDSGLVTYLPFEEGTGTTTQDWSANNNDGTLSSASWTTGEYGNAANTGVYTVQPTTGLSSTSGTVEGWVKPVSGTDHYWGFWQTHDSASTNWVDWIWMGRYGLNTFYFRMGDGSACCNNDLTFDPSSYIPTDTWTHLAFTWSGDADSVADDTMKIYVNGVLITSRTNANFQGTMDPYARVGFGHTYAADGPYDDIREYNRALSQTEIINDMQSGTINKGVSRSTTSGGTYSPPGGVWDDFSDGDYTNNPTWTVVGGSWSVSSNQLTKGDDATCWNDITTGSASMTDYVYELDIKNAENSGDVHGIMFRNTGGTNTYRMWISSSGVSLYNYKSATYEYQDKPFVGPITKDTNWHHWKVIVINNTISFYIDDYKQFAYTDTNQPLLSGNVGVTTCRTDVSVDNVKITPLISANSYIDTTATDTTGPAQPSAPTVTAASSTSLQISWSGVSDNGNTYYYHGNNYDKEGNINNLVPDWKNYVNGWNTAYYGQYVTQDISNGVIHRVINEPGVGDPRLYVNSDQITFDKSSDYLLIFDFKRTSGSYPDAIYITGSIVDDTTYHEAWINAFNNANKIDLGGGWYRYFVPIPHTSFTGSGSVGGFGWYGPWNTVWTAEYSVQNVQVYKIQSATVTTGVKDYYVAGSGTGGNNYYTSSPQTITGLNCFSSYTYTVTGRDNALNSGSASSSSTAKYPIDYVGACSGTGSQGWCWTSTTCYYTGTGCPTAASTCTAAQGTCCSGGSYYEQSCASGGLSGGSAIDRDTSQARCQYSSNGCSAYTWMTNVPTSGTRCCGDDTASDNSYYYSANPASATTLSCERCNAGSYVASASYCGNGYFSSSNSACTAADNTTVTSGYCYSGDITCTAASGANGGVSASLLGNGNLQGASTARVCYFGDIVCADGSSGNGLSATILGLGNYTGSLTTSTSLNCYYGAGSCSNGGYGNGTNTIIYGNGYAISTTCYNGTLTCGSGTYNNGTTCALACSGVGTTCCPAQGTYRDTVTCTAGSAGCGYIDHDRDAGSSYCTASGGTPACTAYSWAVSGGGDITTCCGDDASEYVLSRVCSGGACTTSGGDVACCNANTKCVYGGVCYANGYNGNPSSDGTNESCSSGTWIDGQPPTITFVSPTDANNSYISRTWTYVNVTINEIASTCVLNLSGTNTAMSGSGTNWYINKTSISDGTYYYFVKCNDSANNNGATEIRNITIDTINPSIQFVSPTDANNSNIPRTYSYVNVSIADANLGTGFIDWNRNLVGWWRFNSANDFTDYSTYGNNITNNGSTYTASGKFGGARVFDGISQYIDLGNFSYISSGVSGEYTVSVWIQFNQIQQTFFFGTEQSHNGGVMMQIDASGYIQTYYVSSYYTSTYQVSPNQWYNIVFTQNSSGINLYVNGNYIQQLTTNMQVDTPNVTTQLGRFALNGRYLNGTIDDVTIWSRALSPQEINASYNVGSFNLYNNFTNLASGTYTYAAYVEDLAGNVNTTGTNTITVYQDCLAINTAGQQVTLNKNISINGATCFTVNVANVTINCAGYSITGDNTTSTYGIYSNQFNTTIKNCNINNFDKGIYYSGATNGTIINTNSSTSTSTGDGIELDGGSSYNYISNVIANCTFCTAAPAAGILITGSSTYNTINNSIGANGVSSTRSGIDIRANYNTVLNSMGNAIRGIYLSGSNTILSNVTGIGTTTNGLFLTAGSSNNIINNLTIISNSSYGIYISDVPSNNNIFTNVNISSDNSSAVYIDGGSNITIDCQGKTITGTNTTGTYGVYSNQFNTTIKNCNINNFQHGIYFNGATNGTIANTNANTTASGSYGIYLYGASYNIVTNSTGISSSNQAIYISSGSNYNTVVNSVGISNANAIVINANSNYNAIINSSGTSLGGGRGLYFNYYSNYNTAVNSNFYSTSGIGVIINLCSYNNLTNISGNSNATGIGLYFYSNSSNNIITNSTFMVNSSSAIQFDSGFSNNNTITNSIAFSNNSIPVFFNTYSTNNTFYNNTFISGSGAGTILYINQSSTNNTFYWNTFTGSGAWVSDSGTGNMYNTSIGGIPQGNYYPNIASYAIYDMDNNGWGDSGSQYPISASTIPSKWSGSGADYGPATTKNASNIPIPTLISPTNNNYTLVSRRPALIWNSTDITTWYEINITSNNCAGIFNNNTNVGQTTSNFTPSQDLCLQTEGGTNTFYNWTVRACSSQACGNWSAVWNFSIQPYLAITITNSNVTFGTLIPGNIQNTSNLTITPFTFQNDGNVYANLTNITINQTLWNTTGAGLGTRYLQIAAGNTSEINSFNTTTSTMNWTNASTNNINMIMALNYNDATDTAYIHTQIEIPSGEIAGNKQTYFTFIWQ